MEETEDGLGVFADVITGVLGVVMFTALFFALRALASSSGISGVEVNPELRSALVAQQLVVAEARLARAEAVMAGADEEAVTETALPVSAPAAAVSGGEIDPVAAARTRDFARQQVRRIELEGVEVAAEELRVQLNATQAAAIASFAASAGSRLERPSRVVHEIPRAFYVLVTGDRVHPIYALRGDAVVRDTEHVAWILHNQGSQARVFPQSGRGWGGASAAEPLSQLATTATRLGWRVTLLVSPEGFGMARELLQQLETEGRAATWRPISGGDHVNFATEGLPPL